MSEKKLLAAAKAGDVDRIIELAGFDATDEEEAEDDEPAIVAYKWLLVAADFGHDVDGMLDAVQTGSSLHYDDGQMVEASIHLELGIAYLSGADGLKIDHELAREHLDWAKKLKVDKTTDVAKTFPATRRKLKPDALAVFDAVLGDKKSPKKSPKKKTAKK